ncbi:MAG: DUF1207 domain-containing protein [Planctomycetota bacterium]|nr:MAG: DUF1207 domain-containing protein [Planctomycetota bacterium]
MTMHRELCCAATCLLLSAGASWAMPSDRAAGPPPLQWYEGAADAAPTAGDSGDSSLAGPPLETVPHLGPLDESGPGEPGSDQLQGRIVSLEDADALATTSWTGGPYQWHLMPQGLIYRSYLAGAKESRFRSVWHHDARDGNVWDITLGGNVGLLRYGTRGDVRPEGWQLGIEGAGQVRLDTDEDRDVDAADFRFGIPITWGDAIYQEKLAYYHLSSHLGDEFMLKHPGFNRLNYSRDVLVWGHSIYPTDGVRVYGEVGYAFVHDVSRPWEFQFGIDRAPYGRTGGRGAPFWALNGHLRQEVNYGGNFVAQAGWSWRRAAATGLYRIGVEYYNGKDDQFSFYDNSVEKIGLAMWFDY